jgi:hypothetical protein
MIDLSIDYKPLDRRSVKQPTANVADPEIIVTDPDPFS